MWGKFKINFLSTSNFIRATAMLIGTIIGAGMYGIPYAVSKPGFFVGLLMILILGEVVIILNLAYGEVISRTKGKHQFTGYAEKYLGKRGKILALVSILTGLYGGLIAYIIEVGKLLDFLFPLDSVTSPFFWSLLFFITLSLAVLLGLKIVSRLDTILSILLIIAFVVLLYFLFPQVRQENLVTSDLRFGNLFFPYGVILFSLGGAAILGEVKSVLHDRTKFNKVIMVGTIIPILIYFLFTLVILGTTGIYTSDDSIRGLIDVNPLLAQITAVLAIISMSTSFLGLGTILKDTFNQDFKVPYFLAWILAVFPPFIIFYLGLQSFILVISLSGAVMAGIEGIIIIVMHTRAKEKGQQIPSYSLTLPGWLKFFLFAVFILGIIYEVYRVTIGF